MFTGHPTCARCCGRTSSCGAHDSCSAGHAQESLSCAGHPTRLFAPMSPRGSPSTSWVPPILLDCTPRRAPVHMNLALRTCAWMPSCHDGCLWLMTSLCPHDIRTLTCIASRSSNPWTTPSSFRKLDRTRLSYMTWRLPSMVPDVVGPIHEPGLHVRWPHIPW